ncbi:MAG TPA: UDP-glucose/GDP-mannose dehydrogenase family protein [Actinomycetota bacterium]|nr:UDP-glucose/GDP-mannose dehydrogenase family protein [Actinomycetota bacterium]
MKIAVIGVGHVGLVTAATLARVGHEVVGLDDDQAKMQLLRDGKAPFFEPGLQELLDQVLRQRSLTFTDDPSEAIRGAEVAFICVGTPSRPDGEANLIAVEKAAESAGRAAASDLVIVQKSTVPVHTGDRLAGMLAKISDHKFFLVSNPEFLREGSAVPDSLEPERILVGSDDPFGHEVMRKVYSHWIDRGARYFATDLRTAELAKHACNAFLATKISFINGVARICEASGADVVSIAEIMGSDPRIGDAFLNAGLGYGGYCFPKDVAAFKAQASTLGVDFGLLGEVMRINAAALDATFQKIKDAVWNLEGKKIALLGLSFKAGTDDVRESPSLYLAQKLMAAGAQVTGYDPQANEEAAKALPGLMTALDPYEAAEGADCLVIGTEWQEFAELDLVRLKGILNRPVIVDARNLLHAPSVAEAGFTYLPTGRPALNL